MISSFTIRGSSVPHVPKLLTILCRLGRTDNRRCPLMERAHYPQSLPLPHFSKDAASAARIVYPLPAASTRIMTKFKYCNGCNGPRSARAKRIPDREASRVCEEKDGDDDEFPSSKRRLFRDTKQEDDTSFKIRRRNS